MKLSICIPTYNRNESLKKCIKSINKIKIKNKIKINIIIVDNSKNNNLNDLLRKFDEFKKEKVSDLNKKKLNLKKEIKKFTFYSHFKSLNNIINLNN